MIILVALENTLNCYLLKMDLSREVSMLLHEIFSIFINDQELFVGDFAIQICTVFKSTTQQIKLKACVKSRKLSLCLPI